MIKTFNPLCASISQRSSGLGQVMHEEAYEQLGIPWRYLPICTDDVVNTVQALTALNVVGFAVSKPFKEAVVPLLHEVSEEVQVIGACNTVVNNDGSLVGHNTDWSGALAAIDELDHPQMSKAVIVGTGGVARAIAYGLKQRNYEVHIAGRSVDAGKRIADDLELDGVWRLEQQGFAAAQLVVNATSQSSSARGPVNLDHHREACAVFDVGVRPEQTTLIRDASARALVTVSGWRMMLHQGAQQLHLYSQIEPPKGSMSDALEREIDRLDTLDVGAIE